MDTSIEQRIFHSTMHISTKIDNSTTFTGTAFVYLEPHGEDTSYPFLVSNKHVLMSSARKLTAKAIQKRSDGSAHYGKEIEFDLICPICRKYHIFEHPDPEIDIALIPIGCHLNTLPIYFQGIRRTFLLGNQPPEKGLRERLFEDVMFVGYPNGLYDDHNILPITRFGRVSTPLQFDYKGKPQFLIDASVYGGSSGSPVFVYREFMRNVDKGVSWGNELLLAGVLAAVHIRTETNEIVPVTKFGVHFTKELDLGIVFKSSTVTDVVQVAKRNNKQAGTCQAITF